ISHTYSDHVSILKFIERNWNLPAITNRSRDNLPNPKSERDNPYVPINSPAIGDLFDLLGFGRHGGEVLKVSNKKQGRPQGRPSSFGEELSVNSVFWSVLCVNSFSGFLSPA